MLNFPYLRRDESIPFLRVSDGQVCVEDSLGYEGVLISDEIGSPEDFKEKPIKTPINLGPQDILKLKKGHLQIFVRNSQSPPQIKPAPLFRRDNDSRKYFLLFSLLFLVVLGALSTITIDKEIEEEKKPERVATILYNRKKFIYKKRKISEPKKEKVVPKAPKTPKPKATPKPVPKVTKQTKPTPKPTPKPVTKKATKKPTPKPKPKLAKKPPAKKVTRPKAVKRPTKKTSNSNRAKTKTPRRSTRTASAPRRAKRASRSKGHVDAYRPSNKFAGRLSQLLAKGGKVSKVRAESAGGGSAGIAGADLGGDPGNVQRAEVSKDVGSLAGVARGRLDQTQGTEGLVDKRNVAVAEIPSNTVISGNYDASVVADILREYIPQFRYCYQQELDRRNKVSGKIELYFNIGASGRVTKASVMKSALTPRVEGCVLNVLRGIRFPAPLGGGVVAIRQPMYFEPRSN